MDLQTAIEILEYHQEWRLGKRDDMIYEPKKLTDALDVVISEVKKISKPIISGRSEQFQSITAFTKLPVICRFFGHKIGELNDSGYPVCKRCGCHSYYDAGVVTDNWNRAALFMRPIWFVHRKVYQLKYDVKYWYRRIFLGDTLPF